MPPSRAPDHVLVHLRRARDHADRHFAEPLTLEHLAAVAALSKYHFHRLFTATYGRTPAEHLSERRIERAQDLLRATNLTVTEVCFAVVVSPASAPFSSRFRADPLGESPTAPSSAATGAGRPGSGPPPLHQRDPVAQERNLEEAARGGVVVAFNTDHERSHRQRLGSLDLDQALDLLH